MCTPGCLGGMENVRDKVLLLCVLQIAELLLSFIMGFFHNVPWVYGIIIVLAILDLVSDVAYAGTANFGDRRGLRRNGRGAAGRAHLPRLATAFGLRERGREERARAEQVEHTPAENEARFRGTGALS